MKRRMLYDTLRKNLCLTEELLRFVEDCPEAAEWVKARVPAKLWARLEDRSEFVVPLETNEDFTWTGPSSSVERPESWMISEVNTLRVPRHECQRDRGCHNDFLKLDRYQPPHLDTGIEGAASKVPT